MTKDQDASTVQLFSVYCRDEVEYGSVVIGRVPAGEIHPSNLEVKIVEVNTAQFARYKGIAAKAQGLTHRAQEVNVFSNERSTTKSRPKGAGTKAQDALELVRHLDQGSRGAERVEGDSDL